MGEGPAPVEDRGDVGTPDGEEERIDLENCLDERPSDLTQNCEDLSPPGQEGVVEGNGGDTPAQGTIVVIPLEGSNAELRTRVLKEVRKPGRSEYLDIIPNTLFIPIHFCILFELFSSLNRVHSYYERGYIFVGINKAKLNC